MSKSESRLRREREWEEEQRKIEIERHRKEALTMYFRIFEAETIDDIKDILERMRVHLGIE
jgi:hypothetical protein